MPDEPFRKEFAASDWTENPEHLKAWQRGKTGYPIVDAVMRELWATGYIHIRVRMIAASFLIKHLRIPCQKGEAWFWDTLVDAGNGWPDRVRMRRLISEYSIRFFKAKRLTPTERMYGAGYPNWRAYRMTSFMHPGLLTRLQPA